MSMKRRKWIVDKIDKFGLSKFINKFNSQLLITCL